MTNWHYDVIRAGFVATALGLASVASSCTPATEDLITDTAGSGGSVAPAGTGGGLSSAGSTPANSGGNGGTGGAGAISGAPTTMGGSSMAGADTSSAGFTGTAGAAPRAAGCHWATSGTTVAMNPPSADKIVLFDGTSLNGWHKLNAVNTPAQWKLTGEATMEVVPVEPPTNIQSQQKFEDVCLHVEYMTPIFPSNVSTQRQGNSGIFLKSAYEMQILDTHDAPPLNDGCGSIYKIAPPLVVSCNQFLEWNTYEIEFKSSVWDQSAPAKKTGNAVFVQVALNGQVVQKDVTLDPAGGFTQAGIPDVAGPQPISLQDHRDLVRFRNIWATIPRY